MAAEVFISYASEDEWAAKRVCATLEPEGLDCWMAPRDVPPGGDWVQSIMAAIAESRLLVLVLSAASAGSGHVLREVERAVHRRPAGAAGAHRRDGPGGQPRLLRQRLALVRRPGRAASRAGASCWSPRPESGSPTRRAAGRPRSRRERLGRRRARRRRAARRVGGAAVVAARGRRLSSLGSSGPAMPPQRVAGRGRRGVVGDDRRADPLDARRLRGQRAGRQRRPVRLLRSRPQGPASSSGASSTGGPVRSSPAVAAGKVYVGSFDGNVYALRASDGHQRGAPPPASRCSPRPPSPGDTLVIGANGVLALDARSGAERWRFDTGAAGQLLARDRGRGRLRRGRRRLPLRPRPEHRRANGGRVEVGKRPMNPHPRSPSGLVYVGGAKGLQRGRRAVRQASLAARRPPAGSTPRPRWRPGSSSWAAAIATVYCPRRALRQRAMAVRRRRPGRLLADRGLRRRLHRRPTTARSTASTPPPAPSAGASPPRRPWSPRRSSRAAWSTSRPTTAALTPSRRPAERLILGACPASEHRSPAHERPTVQDDRPPPRPGLVSRPRGRLAPALLGRGGLDRPHRRARGDRARASADPARRPVEALAGGGGGRCRQWPLLAARRHRGRRLRRSSLARARPAPR